MLKQCLWFWSQFPITKFPKVCEAETVKIFLYVQQYINFVIMPIIIGMGIKLL